MGKPQRGGYVAYIRVSTQKQGEHGVSLEAQKDVIQAFAQRESLTISHWAEERESASKQGRPEFQKVLKLLKTHHADGLIFHKIDRGARNHVDWSDLRTLGERGYHVYFAVEGVDLKQAEHLLLADIHAAMASHYIRNLRQEVLKGMKGRLKQGIYPWAAPLGYLDQGGGKAKILDPERAPLVRRAFELYDQGEDSLHTLTSKLVKLGLTNRNGKAICVNVVNRMLRNAFYSGLLRVPLWAETYHGVHAPLVAMSVFDRVQDRLSGRLNQRTRRHDFLFRRMLKCEHCPFALIGELQKGHVYYRCHTRACPTTGVREDAVVGELERKLLGIRYSDEERAYLRARVKELNLNEADERQTAQASLKLRLGQLGERLNRLTDAFLDQEIERDDYGRRKEALLKEELLVKEQMEGLKNGKERLTLDDYLELAEHAWILYQMAEPEIKRSLVELFTSNRSVSGRNPTMMLAPPFSMIEKRGESDGCALARNRT